VISRACGVPRPLFRCCFTQRSPNQDGDGLPLVLDIGVRLGQGLGILLGSDTASPGERVIVGEPVAGLGRTDLSTDQ
jgi:hypothetical protein